MTNVENEQSITVFGADENFCRNPIINYQIVEGFGSKFDQRFSFTAFKWSTARAGPLAEDQSISCKIELEAVAFDPVAADNCVLWK